MATGPCRVGFFVAGLPFPRKPDRILRKPLRFAAVQAAIAAGMGVVFRIHQERLSVGQAAPSRRCARMPDPNGRE